MHRLLTTAACAACFTAAVAGADHYRSRIIAAPTLAAARPYAAPFTAVATAAALALALTTAAALRPRY